MNTKNVTLEEQNFWNQFREWMITKGNDKSLPKGNKVKIEDKQEFSRKITKHCGFTLRSSGSFGCFKIELYVNPEDESSVHDPLQERFHELKQFENKLFVEIVGTDSEGFLNPEWNLDRKKMKKFNVVLCFTAASTNEENWPAINNRLKQLLERFYEVFGKKLGIYAEH